MDRQKQHHRVRPLVIDMAGSNLARKDQTDYWVPSEKEMQLDEHDSLKVQKNGFIDLQFGESGPVVRFAENTECTLTELGFEERDGQQLLHIVIDLSQGSLASDLTDLPPAATFFVRTPYWVVHAQGAVVEAHANGTVIVDTGEVAIDVPDGERFKVGPNEQYSV